MNILSILVFDGGPPKQPSADHQRGQGGGWQDKWTIDMDDGYNKNLIKSLPHPQFY